MFYRALKDFYRAYNPDKIDMVPGIVKKFEDDKVGVMNHMKEKYSLPVYKPFDDLIESLIRKQPNLISAANEISERRPERKTEDEMFCRALEDFYRAYCPDKIDNIPAILKKFADNKVECLHVLKEKYSLKVYKPFDDLIYSLIRKQPRRSAKFENRSPERRSEKASSSRKYKVNDDNALVVASSERYSKEEQIRKLKKQMAKGVPLNIPAMNNGDANMNAYLEILQKRSEKAKAAKSDVKAVAVSTSPQRGSSQADTAGIVSVRQNSRKVVMVEPKKVSAPVSKKHKGSSKKTSESRK